MFFQREWDIIKLKKRARRELPDGDYDTLAGMIMAKLGYIPKENRGLPKASVSCEGEKEIRRARSSLWRRGSGLL